MSNSTDIDPLVAYARSRWEEGEQRIRRHTGDTHRRDVLEDVVDALMAELEKRVGQTFATRELIELQDTAESWCTRIAHEVAPETPWAWELDTVQNAAFHRYARRAHDYQIEYATSGDQQ